LTELTQAFVAAGSLDSAAACTPEQLQIDPIRNGEPVAAPVVLEDELVELAVVDALAFVAGELDDFELEPQAARLVAHAATAMRLAIRDFRNIRSLLAQMT
jgi:hypothetical protein